MSLFGKKEKEELEALKASIPPEQLQLEDIKNEIQQKSQELGSLIASRQQYIKQLDEEIAKKQQHIAQMQETLIETDEKAMLQSFGVYTPHYQYKVSDEYKEKIKEIREKQKYCIKADKAVTGNDNWTLNNSQKQGAKMINDMKKLFLRAFNAECDDAIDHVKFNNFDSAKKKIQASATAISKLGTLMGIAITEPYLNLKLNELHLVHEYHLKKEEEKEALRELKEQQREEAKAAKEIEEAKKKLEKEQAHFENALSKIQAQIDTAEEKDLQALLDKKAEYEQQLADLNGQIEEVDYRAANQKAGYVYIISNIGAFGENVYKIGMTRRLDPEERIDELSSASVPFNFDIHAMIFTEDAPTLENALHKAFENKRVNLVNARKEFFAVTLDEIKQVVKDNFDKTVEFTDDAAAEQFRTSQKLKKKD